MKRAPRKLTPAAFVLALLAPAFGCPSESDGEAERLPYRDAWRVGADVEFPHIGDDGSVQIFDITFGGRESNDNFANRGDVTVNFDGPEDRILVEIRRFTQTASEETALEDFADLSLWAFTSSLGRPEDQAAEDDCANSGWQNGCSVRVYYDGLSQLQRAGADLRVTLPPSYRRKITVVTEDNVADDDYFNRGNVCISNLFASADVETQSGNVWVGLAPEASPAPRCTTAQIDACENWTVTDDDGNETPAPWAPECDCIAVGGGEFGRVAIENRDDSSSNITVDIPEGLWASIRGENQGEGQSSTGEFCESTVTVPNVEFEATGNDFAWQVAATSNYPGEPAIRGAGFSIQAISNQCSPVANTNSPDEFVGLGNGDMQDSTERGNIEICSGCITQSCDELMGG